MSYCYSDTEPYTGPMVPYWKQNPNKSILKHYSNYKYLQFIISNSDRATEKAQAVKELAICERKMGRCEIHNLFDHNQYMADKRTIDKTWET